MNLQRDRILEFRGQNLVDADGDKVGSIEEIYLDAETNAPEWALVNTGLFGTKSTFVPLREATDDGGTLRVPYDKAKVKDAPKDRRGWPAAAAGGPGVRPPLRPRVLRAALGFRLAGRRRADRRDRARR